MTGARTPAATARPVRGQKPARPEVERAMRALVEQLPRLTASSSGDIDFANCPPALLASVADSAETTVALIDRGLSALGCLMAHAATEIGDGSISSDSVEALGWLMAELGDIAGACFVLASMCRQSIPAPPKALWTPVP
jgi:hypothetical protein